MFFKASREIFHSNMSSLLFYGFFLGVPLFFLLSFIITGKGASHELIPGISVGLFFLISLFFVFGLTPVLQYWEIRKSVLTSPSANQEQIYAISENGVRNYGRGVDVSMEWDKIIRLRLTRRFFLMFISRNVAYFIPRDLLSAQEIEQIESWRNART